MPLGSYFILIFCNSDYFTHPPGGFETTFVFLGIPASRYFCCDFEMLLQSSALYLQLSCNFCCMLLIRLPVTWHLLWCWKVLERVEFLVDVWFMKDLVWFHFQLVKTFQFHVFSDIDFIKVFPGISALWIFPLVSTKKLALSILLHLTKLSYFQIFSLHTDSRNLCRQQESLGVNSRHFWMR